MIINGISFNIWETNLKKRRKIVKTIKAKKVMDELKKIWQQESDDIKKAIKSLCKEL